MQKFEFLQQPLLGELAMRRKKEREKEKQMPFIMATYASACSPRAAHELRSDQKQKQFEYSTSTLQVCSKYVAQMLTDTTKLDFLWQCKAKFVIKEKLTSLSLVQLQLCLSLVKKIN